MKNNPLILIALLMLIAIPVHAQFSDEFTGKKLGPMWMFTVPGNTPADTSDATHYSVKGGTFNITLQTGSLQNASAHNIATVMLAAESTGDYTVETKVIASFDKVQGYPSAGLVVLTSPKNFVVFGLQHDNFKGASDNFKDPNYNFTTVSSVISGKMDAKKNSVSLSANYTNVGAGVAQQPVTLSLKKIGQTITFGYISATGKPGTALTLSASDTGDKKAAYDFLSSLGGKQVGLYADPAYTKTTETVSFGFLHLTGVKPIRP